MRVCMCTHVFDSWVNCETINQLVSGCGSRQLLDAPALYAHIAISNVSCVFNSRSAGQSCNWLVFGYL